jgi:hypothetical protein
MVMSKYYNIKSIEPENFWKIDWNVYIVMENRTFSETVCHGETVLVFSENLEFFLKTHGCADSCTLNGSSFHVTHTDISRKKFFAGTTSEQCPQGKSRGFQFFIKTQCYVPF